MINYSNIQNISDEELEKSLSKVLKFFQGLTNNSEKKDLSEKLNYEITSNYLVKLFDTANTATNEYNQRIQKLKSRPDTSGR